jgi:hypothetical protein
MEREKRAERLSVQSIKQRERKKGLRTADRDHVEENGTQQVPAETA